MLDTAKVILNPAAFGTAGHGERGARRAYISLRCPQLCGLDQASRSQPATHASLAVLGSGSAIKALNTAAINSASCSMCNSSRITRQIFPHEKVVRMDGRFWSTLHADMALAESVHIRGTLSQLSSISGCTTCPSMRQRFPNWKITL